MFFYLFYNVYALSGALKCYTIWLRLYLVSPMELVIFKVNIIKILFLLVSCYYIEINHILIYATPLTCTFAEKPLKYLWNKAEKQWKIIQKTFFLSKQEKRLVMTNSLKKDWEKFLNQVSYLLLNLFEFRLE